MARVRVTRNTFNTGIINKDIQGLSDAEMYNNSLRECKNFIIHKTSGAYKRPGSLFVADISDLNLPTNPRIFTWYIDVNTRYWVIPSLDNETGEVLFNLYNEKGEKKTVSLHETKQHNWEKKESYTSQEVLSSIDCTFVEGTLVPSFFCAVGFRDKNSGGNMAVELSAKPHVHTVLFYEIGFAGRIMTSVASNANIALAVGTGGLSAYRTEHNAAFNEISVNAAVQDLNMRGIAYGQNKFIACGNRNLTGSLVKHNTIVFPGTWEKVTIDGSDDIANTVFTKMKYLPDALGNGRFIAITSVDSGTGLGKIFSSYDGSDNTWEMHFVKGIYNEHDRAFFVRDMCFLKNLYVPFGIFLAVGNIYSTDQETIKQSNVCYIDPYKFQNNDDWTFVDTGFDTELHSVTILNKKAIAVGRNGLVIESFDGIHWTRSPFIFSDDDLKNIASTGNTPVNNNHISYIFGVKDIYEKSFGSPDISYLDDFKIVSTSDNSLLILGEESPPLKLSYKSGNIELKTVQFEIPPMSFQDFSVTFYPNFTSMSDDYKYNGVEIGVSSFVTPVMRTVKYAGDEDARHPEINESYIFATWDWKTTPPLLPSDDDDFLCLSYQVPGDTIKYENWWFKTKATNRIYVPELYRWVFLNKRDKQAHTVNPPGDLFIGSLQQNKFCELEPIFEMNPKGADDKPQDLPWWSVVAKDIDADADHGRIPVQSRSNMIATPYNWYVSACSLRKGYFKAAALHENRLWLARTVQYPFGVWASSITANSWLNFTPGTGDGDSLQYQFDFNQANEILWLVSKVKLYVGTRLGIYLIGSASFNDEIMTPKTTRSQEISSKIGASSILPVTLEDGVIFVDSNRNNVREIIVQESGVVKINNLSELSNDILAPTVVNNTCTVMPFPIYWGTLLSGTFVSLTYQKQTNVIAWTRHELGNSIPGRALVKAVDGQLMGETSDLLGMIVERDIAPGEGGAIKEIKTLECIRLDDTIKDRRNEEQYYVDCGVEKQIMGNITRIGISGNATYDFEGAGQKFEGEHTFALIYAPLSNNLHPVPANDFTDAFCYFQHNETNNAIRKVYGGKDYKIDVNAVKTGDAFEAYFLTRVKVIKVNKNSLELSQDFPEGNAWAVRFFNTGTVLDLYNYMILHKVSMNVYTFSLFESLGAIDFEELGVESIEFCFIGRIYDTNALKTDYLTVPGERAYVQYNGIDLAVQDTVLIDGLNHMVDLNKLICEVSEVSDENRAILREIIATKEILGIEYTVSASLDTGKYTAQMNLGLKGLLYKRFNEVEGLNHLEGESVDYLIDGNDGNTKLKVHGGKVTLPSYATYAAVGFAMESVIQPVPLSGGSMIGSSVGSAGRQNDCVLSLYKSLGGQIGESSEDLRDIQYRRANGALVDKPQEAYTGLVRQSLSPSRDILERTVYIKHNGTTSFNILSITQDVTVADGSA